MPDTNDSTNATTTTIAVDPSVTSTATTLTETVSGGDAGAEETKDWQAEATKWQTLSKKNEERAKANAQAAKELEQLRQQSMSDQEKAAAQAKAEGRAEGIAAVATKLAAAEIRAAAAGRLTGEQLEALFEATNLAVFIGEDGEVDAIKVARFVDGIAPKPDETDQGNRNAFPDLGQGARGGTNAALNGDPLLRDLKAKLGIR